MIALLPIYISLKKNEIKRREERIHLYKAYEDDGKIWQFCRKHENLYFQIKNVVFHSTYDAKKIGFE